MANFTFMVNLVFNNVRMEQLNFKEQYNVLIVMLAVKFVIQ